MPPPADLGHNAIWFIDGSLHGQIKCIARRTGFGIAAVTPAGDLLACGHGSPPDWVHDAAGAEAWAFLTVTRISIGIPVVVTDCLGVLQALQAGAAAASTDPSRRLARIWAMVAHNTDDDFPAAAENMTWMPAHGAVHTIGAAIDSRGKPITPP